MLPDWMQKNDEYIPIDDRATFHTGTIKAIGRIMSRIRVQRGHEKERTLPPILKLLLMMLAVVVISVTDKSIVLMAVAAAAFVYLCTWPASDILSILRTSLGAAILAFLIFLPAMLMKPAGIANNLTVVLKVFLSVTIVGMFNHTTQWNHITSALKKMKIPGIFIFTLDITLKYIVILGNLISDLLTALTLRSVGKNNKKYSSVGGIMGTTFLISSELGTATYEAMRCRGFTDDYNGL